MRALTLEGTVEENAGMLSAIRDMLQGSIDRTATMREDLSSFRAKLQQDANVIADIKASVDGLYSHTVELNGFVKGQAATLSDLAGRSTDAINRMRSVQGPYLQQIWNSISSKKADCFGGKDLNQLINDQTNGITARMSSLSTKVKLPIPMRPVAFQGFRISDIVRDMASGANGWDSKFRSPLNGVSIISGVGFIDAMKTIFGDFTTSTGKGHMKEMYSRYGPGLLKYDLDQLKPIYKQKARDLVLLKKHFSRRTATYKGAMQNVQSRPGGFTSWVGSIATGDLTPEFSRLDLFDQWAHQMIGFMKSLGSQISSLFYPDEWCDLQAGAYGTEYPGLSPFSVFDTYDDYVDGDIDTGGPPFIQRIKDQIVPVMSGGQYFPPELGSEIGIESIKKLAATMGWQSPRNLITMDYPVKDIRKWAVDIDYQKFWIRKFAGGVFAAQFKNSNFLYPPGSGITEDDAITINGGETGVFLFLARNGFDTNTHTWEAQTGDLKPFVVPAGQVIQIKAKDHYFNNIQTRRINMVWVHNSLDQIDASFRTMWGV